MALQSCGLVEQELCISNHLDVCEGGNNCEWQMLVLAVRVGHSIEEGFWPERTGRKLHFGQGGVRRVEQSGDSLGWNRPCCEWGGHALNLQLTVFEQGSDASAMNHGLLFRESDTWQKRTVLPAMEPTEEGFHAPICSYVRDTILGGKSRKNAHVLSTALPCRGNEVGSVCA